MRRKYLRPIRLFETRGIILIELLIACALGLLIIAGVLSVYVSSHRSMQLQSAIDQNQADAMAAIHILTDEIQKAGHIGCAKQDATFTVEDYPPYSINADNKLFATDDQSIHVLAMSMPTATLMQDANGFNITTNNTLNFAAQQVLIITDCDKGEIFAAEKVTHMSNRQTIMSASSLHHQYMAGSEVAFLTNHYFYVAITDRKNSAGLPVYALFVEDIHHQKNELVEDISNLTFRYTVFENNHFSEQLATSVSNWKNVVGVTIQITVTTWPITKNWYAYVALH